MQRSHRPLRALVFFLLLALLASAGSAQFGKNKVQYRSFDWEIYHSPHFDVYYYVEEEDLLEKIVSYAESAYDELSQKFDYQIKEPTTLIFYETHSAFEQNNIIQNFIPEGVGAFATDVRHRMVLPVDLPDEEILQLIQHELTHIFEYHILFGGKRSRALTTRPPTWLMEGLASYMAKDEGTTDRMILRDAVVNDQIPSIAEGGVEGFFAYRFGHAAFDFMNETWGSDAVRDFLYEFRNTFGSRVDRALERSFRITAEDFDADFRRWLRKRYLPRLVETGEPSDFGRPFRLRRSPNSQSTSPAASPSGELLAAFTTERQDVDIALWDVKNRRFLRNLTKRSTDDYQYLIAQSLTTGFRMGRDLTFSPDGNQVAVFAKRESDRSLVLIDVLEGGHDQVIELGGAEQPYAPAWSPDGKKIAFSAIQDGQFDIYEIELATGELSKITDDPAFDGAPIYAPDGQSILFSSQVGTFHKIFRVELGPEGQRYQVTQGEWNDKEAAFSPNGRIVYFTSDRQGIDNIWKYDFETQELSQITNVVTGCYNPTVIVDEDGREGVVYTGLWKRKYDLYLADLEEPVAEPEVIAASETPVDPEGIPGFEPDILVAIDDANKEDYVGWRRMFLEDSNVFFGIADNQTYLGQAIFLFSDYLGDRRFIASVSTVDSFQNFDFLYVDSSDRLQWSLYLFDNRDFFVARDFSTGELRRGQAAYTRTGLIGGIAYPLTFYHRVELGAGYMFRDINFQSYFEDPETGDLIPVVSPREDDFPLIQGAIVGDTTLYSALGPHSGHRYRLDASYAPDFDEGGTLTSSVSLDARQYFAVSRRSELAFRLFAGASFGNFPDVFYFGGLDDYRGSGEFRDFAGDRAFYANLEYRFPLIDYVALPFMAFGGIQGRVFLDIAGSWFDGQGQEFKFWDSDNNKLYSDCDDFNTVCPRSAYGWGVSVRAFGLLLNWDVAKEWDFDTSASGYRTQFWIGNRF